MKESEARQIVFDAGIRLVREGLVSRTWGNISYRLDSRSFVITPSGRSYEHLKAAEMVKVDLADLGFQGSIKPSSEKGLHAEIYKNRPEINAVIHTHQMNASTCAAARREISRVPAETARLMGPSVRVAAYALPGTKKLKKAAAAALLDRKAALLANHGAVCIGESMDEAFAIATHLETVCQQWIETKFLKQYPELATFDIGKMHEIYLAKHGKHT